MSKMLQRLAVSGSSSSQLLQVSRCLSTSSVAAFGRGGRDDRTGRKKPDLHRLVNDERKGVFRVLDIGKPRPESYTMKRTDRGRRNLRPVAAPPREKLMTPDQDWGSVWPAARTFHPAVVPLPVRQGMRLTKTSPTPSKWANAELMKIPNFLHLTPPTIKKHCDQLKQFCTQFPQELLDDNELELNLPLTEITSDYLNASSSIRDNRSRIVTLQFRLAELRLDGHARDKFLRLAGEQRYDFTTDLVTLTSDRLPHRKQNREYCEYLIKALYFESNKVEDWESEREEIDDQQFRIAESAEAELKPDELAYLKSLQTLLNQGEDPRTIESYKSSVQKMLGLTNEIPVAVERA